MKNTMTYNGYAGTVEYSEDDDVLFGRLTGIDDIITYEGESIRELREAFTEAVDDYLEHCRQTGKKPEKPFSGKVTLRIPPEVHARLATQAKAMGKSLNQYAADILAHA